MSIKNQEEILDQVILSIKSKRLEETKLQEAIDKLLNTKLQYVNQLNNLQDDLVKLNSEKDDLKEKIRQLRENYDKQLEVLILKEEAVIKIEKKLEDDRDYLREERERLNNESDLLKKYASRLKSDAAMTGELRQILSREHEKVKSERISLDKQNSELTQIKSEYKEKLDKIDQSNINAVNNLKKSEELKQILNDRINENKALKTHLINEDNSLAMARKKFEAEKVTMEKDLETARSDADKQRDHFIAKLKFQSVLDNEIEIRRLRVEKLIREKGVAKELADLEKELSK